jgi:hypothetical protein
MAGLTGRGVLPLLKVPNAGILATQSYSTEVGIQYPFFVISNIFQCCGPGSGKKLSRIQGLKRYLPDPGSATLIMFTSLL